MATDEEYPNREWAERLYKGWQHQLEAARTEIHDSMHDFALSDKTVRSITARELKGLRKYIIEWHRDAVTNRGLQRYDKPQSGDSHEVRSMRFLFAARKLVENFLDDMRGSTDHLLNTLDKRVSAAAKEFAEIEYQWDDAASEQELDLHGAKIVFGDSWNPDFRRSVLRDINKAHQLLKNKGLDWLWYGIIHVGQAKAQGVRENAAAWYDPRQDIVGVTSLFDPGRSLAHELGHRFWFRYMTETERAEFGSEFGLVDAATPYGATNAEEDFAELFAHYVDGSDLTGQQVRRFRSYLDSHKRRRAFTLALDTDF